MGRRRSLDTDEALPLVVRLFWRHGFDRVTLDQVAEALGVTKPTLFRTFGDKETLFSAAIDAYHQKFIKPGEDRLAAAPTLRSGIAACFAVAADRMVDEQNPPGCFLTDTGLGGGFPSGPVADMLRGLQQRVLAVLDEKITTAIDAGELDRTAQPLAVRQYILAQMAALSALSHDATPEATLRPIVDFMIEGLPWARDGACERAE